MSESLILDTCGLLWLASGSRRLSSAARRRIDAASLVGVSAITAWEVGLKSARGELRLPVEAEEWFDGVVAHHRLQVFEVTPRVAFEANRLPWHHRDPADRLIIATARLHHLAVVTADKQITAYAVEVLC